MVKDVYDHTVELLDRKFRFLMESHDISFMLELERFVAFLTENELIRDVAKKLKQEVDKRSAEYLDELKQERECACKLKDQLIAAHPQTADLPDDLRTFAEFDLIVSANDCLSIPKFRENTLASGTKVERLINILSAKLSTLEDRINSGNLRASIDGNLANEIRNLSNKQQFNYKKWFSFNMTSPGRALIDLEDVASMINPAPINCAHFPGESVDLSIYQEMRTSFNKWVDEAAYAGTDQHKYALVNPEIQQKLDQLRQKVQRVYEGVRQEIGLTRLRSQALNRYAVRCHYYNQEQLCKQVIKEGRYVRSREHILTRDLALYLYDQGITTIYRPRFGNREPDLMEVDAKRPMFIEAKAYKDNKAKQYLLDGVKQLHSYLSFLEPDKNIDEAYYVIYRVGGPIYEFPKVIPTNRFKIYPVLVDLGPSQVSASRQRETIVISVEEVLVTISKSERRSRRRSPKRDK